MFTCSKCDTRTLTHTESFKNIEGTEFEKKSLSKGSFSWVGQIIAHHCLWGHRSDVMTPVSSCRRPVSRVLVLPLILSLVAGDLRGHAARQHHAQQLQHGQDSTHHREHHQDHLEHHSISNPVVNKVLIISYFDVSVKSPEHGGDAAVGVDLADDDPEVGDGEDVLAALRCLVEATRIRHGVARGTHLGVLPVGVAQSVAVAAAARKLS